MMRIGVGRTLSKVEAMYFPPPRVDYANADTTRFDIRKVDGSTVLLHWIYEGVQVSRLDNRLLTYLRRRR